jgi:hypothetical protein
MPQGVPSFRGRAREALYCGGVARAGGRLTLPLLALDADAVVCGGGCGAAEFASLKG